MKPEIFPKKDFKYSLDFLKRLNALHYQGKPLSHQKIFNKYNVWIFFQSRIFFSDLKEFAQNGQYEQRQSPSLKIKIQNFTLSTFGLLVSTVAVVSAIIFKKKIFVYSVDRTNSDIYSNDARMDPVYKYLKSSQEPFLEFLHTTFEFGFIKRFFKRRRWVIYIKSIDTVYYMSHLFWLSRRQSLDTTDVDFSSFKPEEREFAEQLLHKYLSSIDLVIFRVKVLRRILSWMRTENLFTIDNTRDYWELILACRMNNVNVNAFQHGHFTKYHVGWLNDGSFEGEIARPNKLFVWSDFWKKELIRLKTYFPEKSIEIGGFKNIISTIPKKLDRAYVGVLIPYEVDSNKSEVKRYIDKLLLCGNIKVFFKLRTDLDSNRQMTEYGLNKNYNQNLQFIDDVTKYISDVDVVAGTYSTFLYDMIAYERPVALLKTSSDFGEGLAINELAETVDIENVCKKIEEIASIGRDILKERNKKLFGEKPRLMHDTVIKLAEGSYLNNR
ncbi:MAG: hypothetical protein AAB719_02665 [Patescibacteria group bacterium]